MNAHLQRGMVLLRQGRHDQAEQQFREALAEDPNDPGAMTMLALALSKGEKYDQALDAARRAVQLAPDASIPHYVLATVQHQRDKFDEAEAAIREAIRLDPEDADLRSRLAAILFDRRQFAAALEAAEQGLELDAEDVDCANIRAMALTKLGRRAEAGRTIDTALRRDPENATSHANMGWTLLQSGDHRKAMEHFREALRIDPTSEWAREGIVEALRARNPVYRVVMNYFFWMSRLSGRAQWGVIIGLWLLARVLRTMKDANPALAPYVNPLLALYLIFCLMTWMARPLFDLLLRLSKFGRLALTEEQTRASNWVCAWVLAALICLGLWPLTGQIAFVLPAAYCFAMILPTAGLFNAHKPKHKRLLAIYAIALGLLGPLAFAALFVDATLARTFGLGFLIGWIAYPWCANALATRS